jgi:uncharacterized protein YbjT (DUF2867 family)
MSNRVLITGASGYIGGSLLHELKQNPIEPGSYAELYALVRTDEQASAVTKYGAKPLRFDVHDEAAVLDAVLTHEINIVFYLIDAFQSKGQENFIKALGTLREKTARTVHFLHVSWSPAFWYTIISNKRLQIDVRRQDLLVTRRRSHRSTTL